MALTRLGALRGMWIEVLPSEGLRELAQEPIQRHPFYAGDAVQLAAAVISSRRHSRKRAFVFLDGGLASAASKEGFTVGFKLRERKSLGSIHHGGAVLQHGRHRGASNDRR